MNDIKFSCPQCGQHLTVAASGANATVTCPQCGQAIIVPSPAPAMANPERTIPGAKVGDGPAPKVPERHAVAAKKKSPVAMLVALVVLTCLVGAVLFAFRENIFKSAKAPAKAVSVSNTGAPPRPVSMPVVEVPPDLPLPEGTNYWTLDVKDGAHAGRDCRRDGSWQNVHR